LIEDGWYIDRGCTQLLKEPNSENKMDNIQPSDDLKNERTNMTKYSMYSMKKLGRWDKKSVLSIWDKKLYNLIMFK
jgi:hypothetical protein